MKRSETARVWYGIGGRKLVLDVTQGKDFFRDMDGELVTLTWDDGEPEPIEPVGLPAIISRDNIEIAKKLNELIAAVNALREAKR